MISSSALYVGMAHDIGTVYLFYCRFENKVSAFEGLLEAGAVVDQVNYLLPFIFNWILFADYRNTLLKLISSDPELPIKLRTVNFICFN